MLNRQMANPSKITHATRTNLLVSGVHLGEGDNSDDNFISSQKRDTHSGISLQLDFNR
jgi:hypothetical protein